MTSITNKNNANNDTSSSNEKISLKANLPDNLQYVKDMLGESADIVIREIRIGSGGTIKAGIIYTDGLSDSASLQNFILETLMLDIKETQLEENLTTTPNLMDMLKDFAMTVGEIQDVTNFDDLFTSLISGDAIFLIDGYSKGFIIGNKHWAERGVTEPTAQTVVRGPREGFSENLRINTALVRRIIKDPNLWMETRVIGRRSKTNIAIMYIKDVVDNSVLEELRARLDRIDIDGILESTYIEELIQDSKLSPFPTVYNTERPDTAAASLLEGQIAIIIDGTPFVLIVPALFTQFFQSTEDYYQRNEMASLLRLLRFFSFGISLLAPGIYVAIITFHQEMLPAPLLISLASQRENVPFPAFIEVVIMEIAFEILREAGLRMPRAIGAAMSIVGGFVVGTAAVEAGIISAAMVIVVSITAIASFVAPAYDIAIAGRMLRFAFIVLAAMFGFYGMTIGLIALILHLCSLSSFGVSYMSPLAPLDKPALKDVFIRAPLWKMTTRPSVFTKNKIKQRYEDPKSDKDK